MQGSGAVVADRDRVGVLVALTDQRGEVLEIASGGGAAEDDLDDARVQIAPVAWSPHLSRAWDSDWSTGIVVMTIAERLADCEGARTLATEPRVWGAVT